MKEKNGMTVRLDPSPWRGESQAQGRRDEISADPRCPRVKRELARRSRGYTRSVRRKAQGRAQLDVAPREGRKRNEGSGEDEKPERAPNARLEPDTRNLSRGRV